MRVDPVWGDTLNHLLKLLVRVDALTWGLVDEDDGGPPRIIFLLQGIPQQVELDYGSAGTTIDLTSDDETDEAVEYYTTDDN